MKKVILSIDTSKREVAIVTLEVDGQRFERSVDALESKSQVILGLIDQLLKEKNIKLEELSEIKVNAGPGSFTGVRMGVSVANTLGWSLGIAVNGRKQIVEPIYEKSNIESLIKK